MGRNTFDVIVVGSGYIGSSVAYNLCREGLRTLLIDKGGWAAGASRVNYGNIQVQDAELGHSLPLVKAGFACFDTIEAELDCSIGLRRLGNLLLVETEQQWRTMAARIPTLHKAGIQAEMVSGERLGEIEPLLDSSGLLGASYCPTEGQVNPFKLVWAYLHRARQSGLEFRPQIDVTEFIIKADRVAGLKTNQGKLYAPKIVLATGAWTADLGRKLGQNWKVPYVQGHAMITAPTDVRMQTHMASAAFFEDIHAGSEDDNNLDVVLALAQTEDGHFLVGEAAGPAGSNPNQADAIAMPAIAAMLPRYMPLLRKLAILRSWSGMVAYTDDGLPLLGFTSGLQGLVLATAFKSTVVITPLVGRLVRQLVCDQECEIDIRSFSPDRFMDAQD